MSFDIIYNFAVIILAAGNSSRLGQPKQTVVFNNTTLLNNTIQKAKDSTLNDIYIVLGANAEQIIPTLDSNSSIVINEDWKLGMGKSIAVALEAIIDLEYDGVVVLLSDQIYLGSLCIDNLIKVRKTQSKGIVLSKYKNGSGPPSFFDKKYFKDLLLLDDDNGAKSIVKNNFHDVAFVAFENGDVDIDTPEDLRYIDDIFISDS